MKCQHTICRFARVDELLAMADTAERNRKHDAVSHILSDARELAADRWARVECRMTEPEIENVKISVVV